MRQFAYLVGYGTLVTCLTGLALYTWSQAQRPDLQSWHTTSLTGEFTDAAADETFSDYMAREKALFQELDTAIYADTPPAQQLQYNRFFSGSLADARQQQPNWNRTIERVHDNPRGAVLLLHGLSDAPYSTRALANIFFDRGYTVLSLRTPGHGTTPAELLNGKYTAWLAAVRIAMAHLDKSNTTGLPIYIVGYSTGAAMALEYALAGLLGEQLPRPSGMILLSPAIGVAPMAALAKWQLGLSKLLNMPKLAWTDILPEYDPYKYNSFTVNAGDQVYQLTRHVSDQLQALRGKNLEAVQGVPPILAFQSIADATVSAQALLDTLFMHLAPENHELVVFDINRNSEVTPLLARPLESARARLLDAPELPMSTTLVVNRNATTQEVIALSRPAMSTNNTQVTIGLSWPDDVYSLSHVALPFPTDDPVYGDLQQRSRRSDNSAAAQIYLGQVGLQGERGVLAVSGDALMRLRHNPFFPYVVRRIETFLAAREGREENHETADSP